MSPETLSVLCHVNATGLRVPRTLPEPVPAVWQAETRSAPAMTQAPTTRLTIRLFMPNIVVAHRVRKCRTTRGTGVGQRSVAGRRQSELDDRLVLFEPAREPLRGAAIGRLQRHPVTQHTLIAGAFQAIAEVRGAEAELVQRAEQRFLGKIPFAFVLHVEEVVSLRRYAVLDPAEHAEHGERE